MLKQSAVPSTSGPEKVRVGRMSSERIRSGNRGWPKWTGVGRMAKGSGVAIEVGPNGQEWVEWPSNRGWPKWTGVGKMAKGVGIESFFLKRERNRKVVQKRED